MYIEYLIKTENFSSYQLTPSTKVSIDDLVKNKKGFQVKNPKIITVLNKLLIEHSLIDDKGEESFKKAFLGGDGVIEWLQVQSQLGYLIIELKKNPLF